LLGVTFVKVANLLADFDGSESSSATGSNTESGSGATPLGSNVNRGKFLGQPGAPSPSVTSNPRMKQTPSPITGASPLQTSGLMTGGLPSAIQSTPGRGNAKRAAMKRKGRVHKHGRFKFQESQTWYAFTTEEGVRVGGGSGIRIRCRPWPPPGVHKQLKIQRQQQQMTQERKGGFAALFSFGRQPTVKEDDEDSSSSGSSLSTLAESEDDDEYSSPDEVETEQPPNWSRKPAHIAAPRDMTNVYRNLFGDQTLEDQLRVLKLKQDFMMTEEKSLKDENGGKEVPTDPVRIEQKIEVDMMIGMAFSSLAQSKPKITSCV
jgi:hypothetical protein